MNKPTNQMDERELLRAMVAVQRRDLRVSRVSAYAMLLLTAALIVSLALLVPRFMRTLDQAHNTLVDTQQAVQRVNDSLDTLEELTAKLPDLSGDGLDKLARLIDALGRLDLSAVTDAVQRLNSLSDYFSGFSLFG